MIERDINIRFFYRKHGISYSIERVFDTIYYCLKHKVNIDIKYVQFYKVNFVDLIKNIVFCYKNKVNGINHIVGDIHYVAIILPRKRTVLTIHDMVMYHNNMGIKRFFFWFFWFYLPCKKMKYITCISEKTKNDLIKIVKCDPGKIVVIPNPVNSDYHNSYRQFNEVCPTILHVGTRNNKNLERVVEAIKDIPCHLRIIGELKAKQYELLKINSIKYSQVSKISDNQMVDEYLKCDIVSFPSTFEGFGMPIIEGQATGRVVITSNLEPMKSVANNAAVLVNPLDVNSIKKGFEEIILNSELRSELIKLGLINVQNYTVESIASQYLNLYKTVERREI